MKLAETICPVNFFLPETLAVSTFTDRRDTKPEPAEFDWPGRFGEFEEPTDRLSLSGWSPALYPPGTERRKDENVRMLTALVQDVDHGLEIGEAKNLLDAWGIEYALHTTYRHTEECHRFRVIIPFHGAVVPDLYRDLWSVVAQALGTDPKTKDCCRFYFVPAHPPGATGYFFHRPGERLSPTLFLKDHPLQKKEKNGGSKATSADEAPDGTTYTHVDLPWATRLHSPAVKDIKLYFLPEEVDDFERNYKRVFCPFHEGKSGEPSAFLTRLDRHWALACPTCKTMWHASTKLRDAFALNDSMVFIEKLGRVLDITTGELLDPNAVKRRGPAERAWWSAAFDPYRHRKSSLDFFPGDVPEHRFNTYDPCHVMQPKAAREECPELLRQLIQNLTGGSQEEIKYLVQWLAYKLRNPDSGSQVALILQGVQGTGKGLLTRLLRKIWGRYLHTIDAATIESSFCEFLYEALLIVANEVGADFFTDKRRAATKLKGWVVGDDVQVNIKNLREFSTRNPTSWILCSNDAMPIVLEQGDRRYSTIQSNWPLMGKNPELPGKFVAAVENPLFVQACVDYLGSVSLDGYNPQVPLDNVARAEIQKSSMRAHEVWWDDECPPDGVYPVVAIYREFARWAKEVQGERMVPSMRLFGQRLPGFVTRGKIRPSAVDKRFAYFAGRTDKVRVYTIKRGNKGVWRPLILGDMPVPNTTTHRA